MDYPTLPPSPIIIGQTPRSLFKLKLSDYAKKNFKRSVYDEDTLYEMLIIAKNENEARYIAFNHDNMCSDTFQFWRPYIRQSDAEILSRSPKQFDINAQKLFIDCEEINISGSMVIMTSEQHATG
jgi:hypothetical protein